jgi:hypothetical protein
MDVAQIFFHIPELSTPRPNGSRALDRTVYAVKSWLEEAGISVQAHSFPLRPYFMELLGLWLALAGLLLLVSALGSWGWVGLGLALLTVAVPVFEVRLLVPVVSALLRQQACNLIVQLPAPQPRGEVILCAHMDSKTELLDHVQRGRLFRSGPLAMGLALVSGALITVGALLPGGTPQLTIRWLAVLTTLPVAAYGLGMGFHLASGRLSRHPSRGAVDDGAAVAVLLAIAHRLKRGDLRLDHTSVTLLFTVGEEAQMQGALAYVRDREEWPLPTAVINLEVVGQGGRFLLWDQDGTAMLRLPNNHDLNLALSGAVRAVTGEPAVQAPQISSDAFAFLRQGLMATTLGSLDAELEDGGLHSAKDNPSRVDPQQLNTTVEVLSRFVADLDAVRGKAQN